MADRLQREVLWLVVVVLAVDVVFVAVYFAAGVRTAPDTLKVAFTAAWTLITLGVVIRGLSRIRRTRLDQREISRR